MRSDAIVPHNESRIERRSHSTCYRKGKRWIAIHRSRNKNLLLRHASFRAGALRVGWSAASFRGWRSFSWGVPQPPPHDTRWGIPQPPPHDTRSLAGNTALAGWVNQATVWGQSPRARICVIQLTTFVLRISVTTVGARNTKRSAVCFAVISYAMGFYAIYQASWCWRYVAACSKTVFRAKYSYVTIGRPSVSSRVSIAEGEVARSSLRW